MRKIIGNKRKFDVYIDVFNERNIKHNEEYCFFKGNVLKNDKFDIFYDNSFMKQPNFHLNDYKGDLTPFLPKNQAFNQKQPLIEEENDLFFDENIQKTYKKIEKSPNNRFSKHFLDLNRCSLSEIEVINKGKYDPGQKSKGLYIKNLHPKAKFLLFCLKSNIFLDFIYFCS